MIKFKQERLTITSAKDRKQVRHLHLFLGQVVDTRIEPYATEAAEWVKWLGERLPNDNTR